MPITGNNLRKELYPLRMVSPEGDVFEKKFLPACNIFPFPSVYRIERQECREKKGNIMMKKFMICVLSFVLVLSMAACGGKTETKAPETDPETTEEILIGGDPATWGPAIGTEDGTAQVMFRKGTGDEDISGDYNAYGKEEALSVSGCTITLKGNDDGCSLATWTDGTYAYSISVASPISGEAFRSLLERNF